MLGPHDSARPGGCQKLSLSWPWKWGCDGLEKPRRFAPRRYATAARKCCAQAGAFNACRRPSKRTETAMKWRMGKGGRRKLKAEMDRHAETRAAPASETKSCVRGALGVLGIVLHHVKLSSAVFHSRTPHAAFSCPVPGQNPAAPCHSPRHPVRAGFYMLMATSRIDIDENNQAITGTREVVRPCRASPPPSSRTHAHALTRT